VKPRFPQILPVDDHRLVVCAEKIGHLGLLRTGMSGSFLRACRSVLLASIISKEAVTLQVILVEAKGRRGAVMCWLRDVSWHIGRPKTTKTRSLYWGIPLDMK
jgi:hypothetical protein